MRYTSVGYASIRFEVNDDGEVLLTANRDGFRSLVGLLNQFLDEDVSDWDHIHLLPGMQLTADSNGFAVAKMQPIVEEPEGDGDQRSGSASA